LPIPVLASSRATFSRMPGSAQAKSIISSNFFWSRRSRHCWW
jgi:hypothetical protein